MAPVLRCRSALMDAHQKEFTPGLALIHLVAPTIGILG
jgi:hypothetical protein